MNNLLKWFLFLMVACTCKAQFIINPFRFTATAAVTNELKYDPFFSATDTPLNGYVGEGGLTWTAHPTNATTTATVSHTNQGIMPSSADEEIYLSNYADMTDGKVKMMYDGNLDDCGLVGHFDPVTRSGYAAGYSIASGVWKITRYDNGVPTVLPGSVAQGVLSGRNQVELRFTGSTIALYTTNPTVAKVTATDATYTSGKSGVLIGAGSVDFVGQAFWVEPPVVSPTSTAAPLTPVLAYGWDTDGSTFIRSPCAGDSLRVKFTGPYLAITSTPITKNAVHLLVRIDGGPWKQVKTGLQTYTHPLFYNPASLGVKECEILLNGNPATTDSWAIVSGVCPQNAFNLTNLVVANGYALSASTPRSGGKMVAIGDSISRGALFQTYQINAERAMPHLVAQARNMDLDTIVYSGQGYTVTAADTKTPKVATAIGSLSFGRTRSPDTSVSLVICAHGTNDGGATQTNLQDDALSSWQQMRTLWPNARIVIVLPFGYGAGTYAARITTRNTRNGWISSKFALWADPNSQIIDPTGLSFADDLTGPVNASLPNASSYDMIHPFEHVVVQYAAYVNSQIP